MVVISRGPGVFVGLRDLRHAWGRFTSMGSVIALVAVVTVLWTGAFVRTGQLGDLRAAGNASRTSRFSRRPIRRSPNPRSTQRRSVPWAVSPASRPSRWASRSSMPKTQPVPRSPSPWSASSPVTSWRRAWLEDRSWTVPAAESSSPERSLLTACAWADAALEQASCYRAARCMPCAPGHALDLDRESAAYGPHASRPPA